MKSLLLHLSIFAASSTSHAFLSPRAIHVRHGGYDASTAPEFYYSRQLLKSNDSIRQALLKQLSSDDDTDPSNTINVAIFSNNHQDVFQTAILNHPFCKMTGASLSIDWIPNTKESYWSKAELDILHNIDIACFSTVSSVKTYLNKLDNHLKVDADLPQEERRKLPNKPDFIADILGGGGGGISGLAAACPSTSTARECLNSGRWMATYIYYPKDGREVELKTESLGEGENKDDIEEDVEIDVDVWAASVMQAAGDVLERKFWVTGW